MKLYVVAAMHGDEIFGLEVLKYIEKIKNIKVRIAHPKAIKGNKRFITSDLNRSFRRSHNNLESKLADSIEKEIIEFKPDYVIDIHTSITNVGKTGIVCGYSTKIENLAQSLGLNNIVIMPKKYYQNSLIGCLPDRSISIELGKNLRSDKLARTLAKNINDLVLKDKNYLKPLSRYSVTTTIDKKDNNVVGIENLKYNSYFKAYPFLANEKAYLDIGGFLAKKLN